MESNYNEKIEYIFFNDDIFNIYFVLDNVFIGHYSSDYNNIILTFILEKEPKAVRDEAEMVIKNYLKTIGIKLDNK